MNDNAVKVERPKLPDVNDSRAVAAHYLAHVQDDKAHVGEKAIDAFDERFSRNEKSISDLRAELGAAIARITTLEQAATASKTAPNSGTGSQQS